MKLRKTTTKCDPLFSEEDADLMDRAWRFDRHGYARRTIQRKPLSPISLFAHHEVCIRAFGRKPDWSKRENCDHINRDRLDNRRENLRIVSARENALNKEYTRRKDGKAAGYTKNKEKFQAQIGVNGKTVYLGLYKTPEEAHAAYRKAEDEFFPTTGTAASAAGADREPSV